MTDPLDELAQLVEWAGGGVGDVDWQEAERRVGFPVPSSYKEYVSRFPAGGFQDLISVDHMRVATDLEDFGERIHGDLRLLRIGVRGRVDFPYRIFPTVPGLVPWGRIDSDIFLCWHLSAIREESPPIVVVDTADGSTETFEGSMAEFICAILRGRISAFDWVAEECDPPRFGVLKFVPRGEGRPFGRADDYRDLDPSGLLTVPGERADAVGDLLNLMGGPVAPQVVDWVAVESQLRHPLPADYKKLVDTVGPGVYGDITVANPTGVLGDLPGLVGLTAEALEKLNRDAAVPTPIGPVVWGKAPDEWFCGWAPGEYPTDQRPILLFRSKRGAHGTGRSMTNYLAWHLQDPMNWDASLWRIGDPE